jgi:hypothetical protein
VCCTASAAGIIVNLLSYSGYYDVTLRDFGLLLAALTLGRLPPRTEANSRSRRISPAEQIPQAWWPGRQRRARLGS